MNFTLFEVSSFSIHLIPIEILVFGWGCCFVLSALLPIPAPALSHIIVVPFTGTLFSFVN